MAKGKADLTVRELASMGGEARAEALSPERRSEIAKKAAAKRWKDRAAKEKRNA